MFLLSNSLWVFFLWFFSMRWIIFPEREIYFHFRMWDIFVFSFSTIFISFLFICCQHTSVEVNYISQRYPLFFAWWITLLTWFLDASMFFACVEMTPANVANVCCLCWYLYKKMLHVSCYTSPFWCSFICACGLSFLCALTSHDWHA